MTTLLLLISLLLHVVAFYFIVVLYMKYSTIKDLSVSQRIMLEETEQSLTSFLIEMKDENEKLLRNLDNSLQKNSLHMTGDEEKKKEIVQDHENEMLVSKEEAAIPENQEDLPQYLAGINEIVDIIEINKIPQKINTPFEIEAIKLYEKGHTVEQIAKKFNKGKTEVELLLKFRLK
jgi:hypothetical protein